MDRPWEAQASCPQTPLQQAGRLRSQADLAPGLPIGEGGNAHEQAAGE